MTCGQFVNFLLQHATFLRIISHVSRDLARKAKQLVCMECLSLPYPVMEEHAVPPATLGPDPE
jgi:hypothetical protein